MIPTQQYEETLLDVALPPKNDDLQRYVDGLAALDNHASPRTLDDQWKQPWYKGRKQTFLPFMPNTRQSFLTGLPRSQKITLALLVGGTLFALALWHVLVLVAILGVCTLLYLLGFLVSFLLIARTLHLPAGEAISEGLIKNLDALHVTWPILTYEIPLYKEASVVPQLVAALKAIDYPSDRLQILFLTEHEDRETRAALFAQNLPAHFQVLDVPDGQPRTKPRALNLGLAQAKGMFTGIFDGEDIPDPLQAKRAILAFVKHGPDVACVQGRLEIYNTQQNLLTRLFTIEYGTWFSVLLPGLQRGNFALPLGGTSNYFRTDILRKLGGWDAGNVAEDSEAGLLLSRYGFKTVVLDSATREEAPSSLKGWIRQRTRWNQGYMQTYLVFMRHPLRLLRRSPRTFLSLQVIVGAWTGMLLINPVLWALTLAYLFFHPVALYHELFPGPIFYLGSFCLYFGNFFYLYVQILGCVKRRAYALIPWVAFLPLYWVMMSIAAYLAVLQVIFRPHHWLKSEHGAHLKATAAPQIPHASLVSSYKAEQRGPIASMPTLSLPAIKLPAKLATTTEQVQAIKIGLRNLSAPHPKPKHPSKLRALVQDRWFLGTMLVALVASVSATLYSYTKNLILIYGDAQSHLEIARRVFDNITPGLAQLGGVWLPLPHLLMLPFVWNNYLAETGLAGSFVGMTCYLLTAACMFQTIKRLTHNSCVSFIGTLLFLLNPNVLFLQSTPLSEPVCWATYTIASYFLLAWAQEGKARYLVLTGVATFFATLARYDGWVLVPMFPVVILFTEWRRHASWQKILGDLLTFLPIASFGIVLWLLWNKIIFGDPLYFQHGAFSSQAQTIVGGQGSLSVQLQSSPILDARLLGIMTVETIGTLALVLAAIGTLAYVVRRWKAIDTLATLTHWAPLAFYFVAINKGQVNLLDSHAGFYPTGIIPLSESIHLFNSRYGSEMVAPAAIFLALLLPTGQLSLLPSRVQRWSKAGWRAILLGAVILQSLWIAYGGVISVISDTQPPFCAGDYPVLAYLQEHYAGGNILETDYPFHFEPLEAGINFRNVIYEGSQQYWDQALADPTSIAQWIIFSPGDRVSQAMAADPHFSQEYTLVLTSAIGLRLYHENGLPPLPSRPLSAYLSNEQTFCTQPITERLM